MRGTMRKMVAGFMTAVMIISTYELPVSATYAVGMGSEYLTELAEPVCMEKYAGSQDGEDDTIELCGTADGTDCVGTLATESVGLGVAYHTQEEIEAYLAESGALQTDKVTYVTDPITSSPYRAGVLSEETQKSAVAMFNQVRYIAGLSYDVSLSQEYNELAQAAALVNYANGALSHTPAKPSDMDETLYQLGYSGASQSNLSWASWETRPINETLIHGWMADDDDGNIQMIGHRRWVLNPPMKQTGFGAVKGSKGIYSAMYAFDNCFGETTVKGVAWPAQNMPVDYFEADYPWSVSMGEDVDISAIKVVLTRKSDGKKWVFADGSADGYFNVNNGGYGQSGCIIFRPTKGDIASIKDGDSYHVEITNNGASYVSYDVNFFEPEKAYTITYHLDGGENNSENPASYRSSSETIVLKDPFKEGYLFDGWYKDSKFTEKITQIEKGSTGNLDLYAKWLARNFDIPYISATTITMNTKRTDGATLSIYAAYGNAVADITAESKEFTVAPVRDESTSEIRGVTIKPVQELANGTYHVELRYATGNSAEDNKYTQDVIIKVVNKTPKLTVKQSAKFNYFYTDEIQTLAVTASDGVTESVLLQDNTDFVGSDKGNGELAISLKNPKITGKPATKATIKVQIQGYREPIIQKVNIAVTKAAPKVVLNRKQTVFSELVSTDVASALVFTDNVRGESISRNDITFSGDEYVSLNEDLSLKPILVDERFVGNKKSVKLTFYVQKANWSQAVKVSHSLKVVGVPAIKLAKKSVMVNGVYKTSEEVAFELTSQSAFEGCQIDWKINPMGDASKSAFLNAEILDNQMLRIGFEGASGTGVKAGTYKYQVSATIARGQDSYEIKPTVLSVKVNMKDKLTVNTSAKGKIDTLQRGSGITYTVKNISNVGFDASKMRSAIKSVELVNLSGMESVADKFTPKLYVNEKSGKAEVTVVANEHATLNTKTAYRFQLKFDVEGLGAVYSKNLTIKPKQSALKTVVTGETSLYKNYLNGTGSVQIKIVKPTGVEIDKLEIEKTTIPKGLAIDESKIVISGNTAIIPYQLTTEAPSSLKVGKSYKIKCVVTPKGMAADKKPQTVSVKFVVKK